MKNKPPSVLITGAAGLLGSHLTDALLTRGYSVTGLDNLSLGTLDNLAYARKHAEFQFLEYDVLDENALEQLPPHDIIAHFAAYKIEVPGLKGTQILEINSRGTSNMLKLARKWKSRFIFSSTSDVYGKNPEMPFSEEHNLVLGPSSIPRWGYAASKIFDEHLCFSHYRQFNIPVTVLRFFNTYGPRHELTPRSGGPQALFFHALLTGNPMIVHGDGGQRRCFAYVDDSIEMTVLAMESEKTIGEILNVGNPFNEISILELARLAYSVHGGTGEPPIEFVQHEKAMKTKKYDEVSRRIPDISKAIQLLGFTPSIGNREGLEKTYSWQKELPVYKEIS